MKITLRESSGLTKSWGNIDWSNLGTNSNYSKYSYEYRNSNATELISMPYTITRLIADPPTKDYPIDKNGS